MRRLKLLLLLALLGGLFGVSLPVRAQSTPCMTFDFTSSDQSFFNVEAGFGTYSGGAWNSSNVGQQAMDIQSPDVSLANAIEVQVDIHFTTVSGSTPGPVELLDSTGILDGYPGLDSSVGDRTLTSDFSSHTLTHVRFYYQSNSSGGAMNITAIRVYCGSSGTNTPTPTPSSTPTASIVPSSTSVNAWLPTPSHYCPPAALIAALTHTPTKTGTYTLINGPDISWNTALPTLTQYPTIAVATGTQPFYTSTPFPTINSGTSTPTLPGATLQTPIGTFIPLVIGGGTPDPDCVHVFDDPGTTPIVEFNDPSHLETNPDGSVLENCYTLIPYFGMSISPVTRALINVAANADLLTDDNSTFVMHTVRPCFHYWPIIFKLMGIDLFPLFQAAIVGLLVVTIIRMIATTL